MRPGKSPRLSRPRQRVRIRFEQDLPEGHAAVLRICCHQPSPPLLEAAARRAFFRARQVHIQPSHFLQRERAQRVARGRRAASLTSRARPANPPPLAAAPCGPAANAGMSTLTSRLRAGCRGGSSKTTTACDTGRRSRAALLGRGAGRDATSCAAVSARAGCGRGLACLAKVVAPPDAQRAPVGAKCAARPTSHCGFGSPGPAKPHQHCWRGRSCGMGVAGRSSLMFVGSPSRRV